MIRHLTLLLSVGFCLSALVLSCASPEGSCQVNGDCKDKTQNCKEGTCTTIKCKEDSDCRSKWYCNTATSKCQSTPAVECKEDTDCKNREKCDSGKCVAKPECAEDSDCTDNSKPECKSGKCVEKGCSQDDDCGDPKKICKDSKCVAKPVECEKDSDCKDSVKTECKDGTCIEPLCSTNSDCKDPKKPLCVNTKCSEDRGRAEGEKCEPKVRDCKLNLVCNLYNGKIGYCRVGCNPYRPKCPTGKVCQQIEKATGACVESNKGKSLGEECDKDKQPCELNLACKEWKGKKICVRPCDETLQDCDSGEECYTFRGKNPKSYCVSRRDPCGIGRPCANDYLCESGFCNPAPSCEDITCKEDQVCDKGVCRNKRCPDDISCPTNSTCLPDGTCAYSKTDPGCVPCSQQQPCSGGGVCLSGLGGSSTTSHCFDNCTPGSPCSNGNFFCNSISVRLNGVNCNTNADCQRQDPRFTQCNSGTCVATFNLCTPKIGSCTNKCKNVNCQGKDVCVPSDGTCVTPYKKLCATCKHPEECGGAKDLCVTFTQGSIRSSYCSRDCSKDPCPTGYTCNTLQNGAKQCIPSSQKCPP